MAPKFELTEPFLSGMNKSKAIISNILKEAKMRQMIISIVAYRPKENTEGGEQHIANKVFQKKFGLVSEAEVWGQKRLDNMFPKTTWKHVPVVVELNKAENLSSTTSTLPEKSDSTEPIKPVAPTITKPAPALTSTEKVKAIVEAWWESVAPEIHNLIGSWNAMPSYRLTFLWSLFLTHGTQEYAACQKICISSERTKSYVEEIMAELIKQPAPLKKPAIASDVALTSFQETGMAIAFLAGDILMNPSKLE